VCVFVRVVYECVCARVYVGKRRGQNLLHAHGVARRLRLGRSPPRRLEAICHQGHRQAPRKRAGSVQEEGGGKNGRGCSQGLPQKGCLILLKEENVEGAFYASKLLVRPAPSPPHLPLLPLLPLRLMTRGEAGRSSSHATRSS